MSNKIVITFFLLFLSLNSHAQEGREDISVYNKIYEYCLTDFQGGRLKSNSSLKKFVTWEEESGWDHFTIIDSFQVTDINITNNTATAAVQYVVLGSVDGPQLIRQKPSYKTITFNLKKTTLGWRIDNPLLPPHVSLNKAKELLK